VSVLSFYLSQRLPYKMQEILSCGNTILLNLCQKLPLYMNLLPVARIYLNMNEILFMIGYALYKVFPLWISVFSQSTLTRHLSCEQEIFSVLGICFPVSKTFLWYEKYL
jgi:hypothetical protein